MYFLKQIHHENKVRGGIVAPPRPLKLYDPSLSLALARSLSPRSWMGEREREKRRGSGWGLLFSIATFFDSRTPSRGGGGVVFVPRMMMTMQEASLPRAISPFRFSFSVVHLAARLFYTRTRTYIRISILMRIHACVHACMYSDRVP